MNSLELGKRIKEARLAKNMTQQQVVGEFITRNMLSQIESGNANPSIRTLKYLSEVLEIPVESLVGEESEFKNVNIIDTLISAKMAYSKSDFEQVMKCDESNTAIADEIFALKARAALELSQNYDMDDPISVHMALNYAKMALEYSKLGIYSNPNIEYQAKSKIAFLAKKLSEYYANFK